MGTVKTYGAGLISLLIALIALTFVIKVLKKAPIVGGVVAKAGDLAGVDV